MNENNNEIIIEPRKSVIARLREQTALFSLIISIISLGIASYSFYVVRHQPLPAVANNGGDVVFADPIGILQELPQGYQSLGNPNAPITIIEFADYQCPFCGRFFHDTFPQIKKEYIDTGKARFVYLNFPFLGQESYDAVNAAGCAAEQGKFWQYHDQLFNNQNGENQGGFNSANLVRFAKYIGLNTDAFTKCFSQNKYSAGAQKEFALGKKYGIGGTPGFLIGNNLLRGAVPFENFKQAIENQ